MADAGKILGGGVGAIAGMLAMVALIDEPCPGSNPRRDACLCWQPPTQYENQTNIPATQVLTYRIYRDNALVTFPEISQAGPAQICRNLANEPPGEHAYQVTAAQANEESQRSNTATKFIRAPAPTEGAIEAPTDGGIEDL